MLCSLTFFSVTLGVKKEVQDASPKLPALGMMVRGVSITAMRYDWAFWYCDRRLTWQWYRKRFITLFF